MVIAHVMINHDEQDWEVITLVPFKMNKVNKIIAANQIRLAECWVLCLWKMENLAVFVHLWSFT